MNLLGRLGLAMMAMSGESPPSPPGPDADYWYEARNRMSAAGQPVTVTSAEQISTVYTCTRVLAETLASLPLHVNRRLPNGDTERVNGDTARSLPPTLTALPTILGLQPGPDLTRFRFIETSQRHVVLRGNTYSRIRIGHNSGMLEGLEPLNPDRVQPYRTPEGAMRYRFTPPRGGPEILLPDEVLHVRGLSDDGFIGKSPIEAQRETLGLSLAAVDYGSRFFANDVRPSIHFKHPGKLSDPAYARLQKELQSAYGGVNRFRPALLEEGMDIARISITNEEAQFLETRRLSREEICAIFRVPQHLAGILDHATFSNIEHQGLQFVIYTILPYCTRWEEEINSHPALLGGQDEFFAEFNVDALLRGDLRSRYEAYAIGRNWGWLNVNEVRRKERLNGIGTEGDTYLQPANMNRAGDIGGNPQQQGKPPQQRKPPADDEAMAAPGV